MLKLHLVILTCCVSVSDKCKSYELMSVCSDSLNDDEEGILPPSDVQHPENLVCKIVIPAVIIAS